jgi:hypothetical protein
MFPLNLIHYKPIMVTVFTKELAKRLGDAAMVTDADPGFVASDIWRNNKLMVRRVLLPTESNPWQNESEPQQNKEISQH